MFALVDCNSFFASAERVFQPALADKPVCVLSNNDGCVVSLTNEAKALGIRRGDPLFKIKDIVEKKDVAVFSSNYVLYAAMSARVMHILSEAALDIDVYSIDEAFLNLEGITNEQLKVKMAELAARVPRWTGIPISIGVAPTKTLAKVAAKYAKKYKGYHNVCFIDSEEKRKKALANFPIADVWGIGRQSVKKLEFFGITTAAAFAAREPEWIKRNFNVTGLRTWNELRGTPCIELDSLAEKQSICVSRSFGKTVTDYEGLKESVANFAADVARKLRKQRSAANIITVFIRTDRFNTSVPQYSNFLSQTLTVATADTAEIITFSHEILKTVFRRGFAYKKAGVIASGIIPDTAIQQHIFDTVGNRDKRQRLNKAVDVINAINGRDTIKYAAQESASGAEWSSRKDFKSRNYLTNINELIEVRI